MCFCCFFSLCVMMGFKYIVMYYIDIETFVFVLFMFDILFLKFLKTHIIILLVLNNKGVL